MHSTFSGFIKKAIGASLLISLLLAFSAHAYDGRPQPKVADEPAEELVGVGIEEKRGDTLDLSLEVTDETGKKVTLGSFFDGKHPVILSPIYFSCPGLCNFHLNGLIDALKLMDKEWTVGTRYQVLALSFDSKETPDLAATKKQTYMKLYDREGSEAGWHFLTADEETIQKITQSVGFGFKWDEKSKEWAHASAAIILTPKGVISRYLPGIVFNPQDIKLSLTEASEGKIGTFVDHLVLYCFRYDPSQSKYTLAAFRVMQVAGGIMVLGMVLWLLPTYIRSRRAKSKEAGR